MLLHWPAQIFIIMFFSTRNNPKSHNSVSKVKRKPKGKNRCNRNNPFSIWKRVGEWQEKERKGQNKFKRLLGNQSSGSHKELNWFQSPYLNDSDISTSDDKKMRAFMSARLWPGQEGAVHSACTESYLCWQTQSSKAQNLLSTQMPFTWLLNTLYTDVEATDFTWGIWRGAQAHSHAQHTETRLCSSVRWCGENPWERLPPGGHLGEAPPCWRRNNLIAAHGFPPS